MKTCNVNQLHTWRWPIRPNHVVCVYIYRKEEEERQLHVHIDGKDIPKTRSIHCNRILQYSVNKSTVYATVKLYL
jgi:hypothetical protein